MAKALKDANRAPLLFAMVANLAIYYVAVRTGALFSGDALSVAREWMTALPVGMGAILAGVLNAQLSSEAKARLVFWRWRNPLPGCQAFTRYAASDPRVDLSAIERAHGPLPTDPRQQNSVWYRFYRSVCDEPAVSQVHRQFLFTRDYACMSFLFLIVLGTGGVFQIPSTGTALTYLAVLLAQYLFARQAAKHHGCRFVTTVLALKGAEA